MADDEFYRPEMKDEKAVEYTTAELRERKELTDKIVRNLRIIIENSPPIGELEQLDTVTATIIGNLKVIEERAPSGAELDELLAKTSQIADNLEKTHE
jgi:hypothetical protein